MKKSVKCSSCGENITNLDIDLGFHVGCENEDWQFQRMKLGTWIDREMQTFILTELDSFIERLLLRERKKYRRKVKDLIFKMHNHEIRCVDDNENFIGEFQTERPYIDSLDFEKKIDKL